MAAYKNYGLREPGDNCCRIPERKMVYNCSKCYFNSSLTLLIVSILFWVGLLILEYKVFLFRFKAIIKYFKQTDMIRHEFYYSPNISIRIFPYHIDGIHIIISSSSTLFSAFLSSHEIICLLTNTAPSC